MFNDEISRKKVLSAAGMYLIFSILQRGKPCCFLELPAEMFGIILSAVCGNNIHGTVAVCKKIFSILYTAFYNILHKSPAKRHFV